MKSVGIPGIGVIILALGIAWPALLFAKSVGMERDGIPGCASSDDMGLQTVGAGVAEAFDIYFYDMDPVFRAKCTFCIQDATRIEMDSVSYTFNTPGAWTDTPIRLVDTGTVVNRELRLMYPNMACWLVQSTDFTFSAPSVITRHGTVRFKTSAETCIGLIIDGDPQHTNVFFTDFTSAGFDQEGETCAPFTCNIDEPLQINLSIPASPVPNGKLDVPYPPGTVFTASGGVEPYTWTQSGLPAAMGIDPNTGEIQGTPAVLGSNIQFIVKVTDAESSHNKAASFETRSCAITIEPAVDGVTVVAQANGVCTDPGANKPVYFDVSNVGDRDDTFALSDSVSRAGWTTSIVGGSPVAVAAGETVSVAVDVGPPGEALCTDEAKVYLRAAGQFFSASGADSLTETVCRRESYTVNEPADQYASPGEEVLYCWTITNTGNCSLNLDATRSSIWPSAPPAAQLFVLPGETSDSACFTHSVPGGALPGASDDLCISFAPAIPPGAGGEPHFPLSYCATTTVRASSCGPGFTVAAAAGNPDFGAVGQTLTFTFDIDNLSDSLDRYELFGGVNPGTGYVVSIQGGTPTPEFTGLHTVDVDVTIPDGALCADQPEIYLSATSDLCDPPDDLKWASDPFGILPSCTFNVEAKSLDYTGAPGEVALYQFRITNSGNCEAAPVLQYLSGWDATGPAGGPLGPGKSQLIEVEHTIPANAQPGEEMVVRMCADCEDDVDKDGEGSLENCDQLTTRVAGDCDLPRPVLKLGDLRQLDWDGTYYTVQVKMINSGPGRALGVTARMDSDIEWLGFQNAAVYYGDLNPGAMSWGEPPSPVYIFDMTNWPGGGFNVWFDVAFADSCKQPYLVRLDPEIVDPGEWEEPPALPASLKLMQNVPNPFNPRTTIVFKLPADGDATLEIFNAVGQRVRTLWSGHLPGGTHQYEWYGVTDQGNDAPSGVYFYTLRSGDDLETKRLVLLR